MTERDYFMANTHLLPGKLSRAAPRCGHEADGSHIKSREPIFMLQTMYRQMVIRSLRKQGNARGLSVYVPALSLVSL